jgi:predicted PurR-regulated permease PerM
LSQHRSNNEVARLFGLIVGVVAIATLYFAQAVLVPLALALFLSLILTPLVKRLEKIHLPRVPAVLLVVFLAMASAVSLTVVITNQLLDVTAGLPTYRTNIEKKLTFLHDGRSAGVGRAITALSEVLDDAGRMVQVPSRPQRPKNSRIAESVTSQEPVDVRVVTPPVTSIESVLSFLSSFAVAIVVLVFTIFILLRAEDLRGRFVRLVGHHHVTAMTQAMDEASQRISKYLLLQVAVNLSYGVIIGAGLRLIGLPNALLWGAIAAVFRFLPYIGPPLGALLPILFSLAVFDGWHGTLMVLALFTVVETVAANLVEPVLYGANTGISSLAILAAAVFWTVLWGPVGLVLSTPLTVCLVVLGRYVPQLEFLHVVLGDEPVLTPAMHFYQRLLASDLSEAREVVDEALKKASLLEVYDSVVVPALSLLQQHRQQDDVDETFAGVVVQNARDVVEELNEEYAGPAGGAPDERHEFAANRETGLPAVVCVASRTHADETIGIMLAQVLERKGRSAECLPLRSHSETVAQLVELRPEVVVVSALQPSSLMQARRLASEIRVRMGKSTVIVGLWNFTGAIDSVWSRFGMETRQSIVTSLTAAVERTAMLSTPPQTSAKPHAMTSR